METENLKTENKKGQGKIDITVGGITFSGEGDQAWLGEQLDRILTAATQLGPVKNSHTEAQTSAPSEKSTTHPANTIGTLASHIRSKGGDSNQVKRFLAAADWLRLKGDDNLTTAKVTKALTDNHQKRLSNPADCLNSNVSKGHCEKANGGFYITPEGKKELGYES